MSVTMTEPTTDRPEYSQWILALRQAAGMTQLELANRLGIDSVSVSRWENGHKYPHRLLHGELQALGKRHGLPPMPKRPKP